MRTITKSIGFAISCVVLTAPLLAQAVPTPPTSPHRALLDKYCIACHNDRAKTGGLTLEKIDVANVPANAETWEKVIVKLRSRSMPPPGIPRPDNATYDAAATWLESEIDRAAAAHVNPGKPASLRIR